MKRISEPLEEYLKKAGLKKQHGDRDYMEKWSDAVGERISSHARPVALKEGKLFVEVSDSTWRYHLTMLKPRIIKDLNRACGQELVSEVIFRNADFRSQTLRTKEGKDYTKSEHYRDRELDRELKKTVLEEKEQRAVQEIAERSPTFCRNRIGKIVEKHFRMQKWKKQKGALHCRRCGVYCLREEQEQGYCLFCARLLEEWTGPLKRLLHHYPWLGYEELSARHPLLDYHIYRGVRERILHRYMQRIQQLWCKGNLSVEHKKKILLRLAQRYVLLFEEKKPDQVRQEDIYRALKIFPGLHPFLYEDTVEQEE